MILKKLTGCLLVTFAFIFSAIAQSDEIVVTGTRLSSYDNDAIPVVHLKRRPDFVIVNTYIESDSRDKDLRRREVFSTIVSLEKAVAKNKFIELGLVKT